MTSRILCVVAALGVSLLGCGSADEAPAERDRASYELHPWVTELGDTELDALVESDPAFGTLRFAGVPERVASRQPGDVLIAGKSQHTPKGLLRAVVSVSHEGGDTVVETVPVPLPLAFAKLHAKLAAREVSFTARPAASSEGPTSQPQWSKSAVVGDQRVFDLQVYDVDQNPKTKNDQLYVHAELEGKVAFTASVDLDWLDSAGAISHAKDCLKKLVKDPTAILSSCVTLPDVKVGFDASLSGNALLDVDGAASKPYVSEPILLNDEPWELPELWVGPVLLTPSLDFTARLEGDSATYFHSRTEHGFDVGVAVSVGTKSGVSAPAPKLTKKFSTPTVEVSSTGRSKASFGPRLSLLAYDTFGLSTELHAFGELTADQGKSPCWDYRLGFELTPAIRLTIPWKKFGLSKLAKHMGWNKDYAYGALGSVTLYDAHPFADLPNEKRACALPPPSALPLGEGPTSATYQNPTFTPWAKRLGGVQATHPFVEKPGQARALVEKAHGSSWVVSGAHVGSVTHLSDSGGVAWNRPIELGLFPDEAALALEPSARGALAVATSPMQILVASDRFTLVALDYDGKLAWRRRLRLPSGLPGPELRELSAVALTPLPGGDVAVLYSRTTPAHVGSELVLVRASAQGAVRFARRIAFPTGQLSLGGALVPVGQDVVVGGQSFDPSEEIAYFARFDADGELVWARRLGACGSTRVRIADGTLRASGDLAFIGTHEMSPERTFVATVSTDGEARGAAAFWTGSILQDVTGVAVRELPTSGFVTLSRFTPMVGNRIELGTHDSQAHRTSGDSLSIELQAGGELAHVAPSGLSLTTDGGALLVAHVSGDQALNDHGLWVAKLPARTFELPAGQTAAQAATSSFPNETCSLDVTPASVKSEALELEEVDAS